MLLYNWWQLQCSLKLYPDSCLKSDKCKCNVNLLFVLFLSQSDECICNVNMLPVLFSFCTLLEIWMDLFIIFDTLFSCLEFSLSDLYLWFDWWKFQGEEYGPVVWCFKNWLLFCHKLQLKYSHNPLVARALPHMDKHTNEEKGILN